MGRRKGSANKKPTASARKAALERAKDEQKLLQQQATESSRNSMEATTATTTKTYTKTNSSSNNVGGKYQQQSSNNQGRLTTTNATAATTKRQKQQQQQQQTYRNDTATADQTKSSNSRAANNSVAAAATAAATGTTAATTTTSTSANAMATTANISAKIADLVANGKLSQAQQYRLQYQQQNEAMKSQQQRNQPQHSSSSNNNVKQHSDNSLSISNSSSNKARNHSNDQADEQQQHLEMVAKNAEATAAVAANSSSTTATTAAAAVEASTTTTTSTPTSTAATKYLHKKFKRLASTNELDEQNAAAGASNDVNDLRQPSLSDYRTSSISSASSVASPPPSAAPTASSNQQQHSHDYNNYNKIGHEQQNASLTNGYPQRSMDIEFNNNNKIASTATTAADSNAVDPQQHGQVTNYSQSNSVTPNTTSTSSSNNSTPGRHVCPYCNVHCTKPSVLQKHIRAHTNERPYPCEICGIAFKTKSNHNKHCRSRSHAARKRGIALPPDADDGSFGANSDQEIDAELSNSSSELLSRTDSPLDERSNLSPAMHMLQHHQQQQQTAAAATPSKSAFVQQPAPQQQQQQQHHQHHYSLQQQQHQQQQQQIQQLLPLGSPAAGTLPPTTATIVNNSSNSAQRQSIDYKPYKPKFHNAALYATAKEATAAKQQQQQQQQHRSQLQPSPSPTPLQPQQHNAVHQLQRDQSPSSKTLVVAPQPHAAAAGPLAFVPHVQSPGGGVYFMSPVPAGAQELLHASGVALAPPPPHPHSHPFYAHQLPYAAAVAASYHLLPPHHHQMQHQQQQFHLQQMQLQQQQQQHAQLLKAPAPPPPTVAAAANQHSNSQQRASVVTSTVPQSAAQQQQKHQQQHFTHSATATAAPQQTNIATSAANTSGAIQLNKEFLEEHISKLISQNEAIVECKELLLQKKYPKALSRSRSFTNQSNASSVMTNGLASGAMSSTTPTTTTTIAQNSMSNNSSTTMTSSSSAMQATTATTTSESANAKLAHAIVQKQQQQQQLHQMQQLQMQQAAYEQHYHHQQQQHSNKSSNSRHTTTTNHSHIIVDEQQSLNSPPVSIMPPNGISKHIINANKQQILAPPSAMNQPYRQQQQYVGAPQLPLNVTAGNAAQSAQNSSNVPLNLSAKSKSNYQHSNDVVAATAMSTTPPRKRHSIEITSSSNAAPPTNQQPATLGDMAASKQKQQQQQQQQREQQQNNSIIKHLLLNARGLAQPTGEGDDAVYVCPLCTNEFRTAEELQLHNSTYCQGLSHSAPSSPSSDMGKYLRSNSISINLKTFLKNPLPLAKLAWSQLKTKPSSLVYSYVSESQAGSAKAIETTTTSATCTAPTATSSSTSSVAAVAAAIETPLLRFVDAPLPSPGPLLGKTPLVDFQHHSASARKPSTEDVVITKMHDERHFLDQQQQQQQHNHAHQVQHLTPKRAKYDNNTHSDSLDQHMASDSFMLATSTAKRQSNHSGGDMQTLPSKSLEHNKSRYSSSGGSMIPISECNELNKSPRTIRTPLLSGGSFQEMSPKTSQHSEKDAAPSKLHTTASMMSVITGTPKLTFSMSNAGPQHFQFPPINSITGFNPLTLPTSVTGVHINNGGEKHIPYVPGIPGPSTLTPSLPHQLQLPMPARRTLSPHNQRKKVPSPMLGACGELNMKSALSPFGGVQSVPSEFSRVPPTPVQRSVLQAQYAQSVITSAKQTLDVPKPKSFNYKCMADNLSPGKAGQTSTNATKPEKEVRHFNFDNLSKQNCENSSSSKTSKLTTPLHIDTMTAPPSVSITTTSSNVELAAANADSNSTLEIKRTKFLRPTSLPLKPGTFTPKRHHGITPTANTLPLISPETPRPSKACGQLYLNGHAYTYLGLKSSTKMFYCTVNCPQPSYVAGMHKLSMYSVWQVCAENNPHPLGFKPKKVMALYDSRQKLVTSTMAGSRKMEYTLVNSQRTVMTPFLGEQGHDYHHLIKQINSGATAEQQQQIKNEIVTNADGGNSNESGLKKESNTQLLVGGYESHEDYTYIRGRGRGRYVCSECGIRCKKPSMLKKHIRTHTDVRPFTCKHCNFSFKTKGNLTKHMQSKTHFKKCIELGINPGPMPADGEFLEPDVEFDQQSTNSQSGPTSSMAGESDSEDGSTDNESESSDTDESKSRLPEHEAARCLLSLSMTPPIAQSVSPQLKTEQQTNLTTSESQPNNANSSNSSSIKRVVSFTSPKPPFDYQKQEKYYSNPEESKPKRFNNNTTTSFESAPIDLTKPRRNEQPSQAAVSALSNSSARSISPSSKSSMSPCPGPMQTQAQIHDIIFGSGNNESGFMKAMISVSDKVRISSETNNNKLMEVVLSSSYVTEQAMQYRKIKQSQIKSNFIAENTASGSNISAVSTGVTMSLPNSPTTSMKSNKLPSNPSEAVATTIVTSSSLSKANLTPQVATKPTPAEPPSVNVAPAVEVPPAKPSNLETAEVISEKKAEETKPTFTATSTITTTTAAATPFVSLATTISTASSLCKSSDEGEESECPSDQEHTTKPSQKTAATTSSHNANLPAAVHQPGTTDFTGVLSAPARTVIVGEDGFKKAANNEIQPVYQRLPLTPTDGRSVCPICSKTFQKQHQLQLHMNIHYMERKFKCEACGVSFRTHGHLQKHERSEAHKNKVMMTSTFGVPTTSNPRPFECTDCKIAFRIHGHLAKHLRSKTHVQKLECLQKLPFGTYSEIERAGINLTEIDTSDCDNSLLSLRALAEKLKLDTTMSGSGGGGQSGGPLNDTNSNTGLGSQDSASEDGFSAAASAAASAIASLDNDSATNTPKRASSMSEDEAVANALNNNLKRRLPGSFSNGEDSDSPMEQHDKRIRLENASNSLAAAANTTTTTTTTTTNN